MSEPRSVCPRSDKEVVWSVPARGPGNVSDKESSGVPWEGGRGGSQEASLQWKSHFGGVGGRRGC